MRFVRNAGHLMLIVAWLSGDGCRMLSFRVENNTKEPDICQNKFHLDSHGGKW